MGANQTVGGTAADEETAGKQPKSRMANDFAASDGRTLG